MGTAYVIERHQKQCWAGEQQDEDDESFWSTFLENCGHFMNVLELTLMVEIRKKLSTTGEHIEVHGRAKLQFRR